MLSMVCNQYFGHVHADSSSVAACWQFGLTKDHLETMAGIFEILKPMFWLVRLCQLFFFGGGGVGKQRDTII